jgi:hypothetical protein
VLSAREGHDRSDAFVAVRDALIRDGVSVDDVHPSTPINSLSGKQLRQLIKVVDEMEPGIVPDPVIVHSRRQRIGSWLVIIAMLGLVAAVILGAGSGAYIAAGVGVVLGLVLKSGDPTSVTLDGYETVGDLVEAAASSRSSPR